MSRTFGVQTHDGLLVVEIENVHPLQSGILRLKYRTDRRPGLPIEPAWSFYPSFIAETLRKYMKYYSQWRLIDGLRRSIRKDAARADYRDEALAPVEPMSAIGPPGVLRSATLLAENPLFTQST